MERMSRTKQDRTPLFLTEQEPTIAFLWTTNALLNNELSIKPIDGKLEPDAEKISDNAGATSKHLTINSPFHWADLRKNGAGCKKISNDVGATSKGPIIYLP